MRSASWPWRTLCWHRCPMHTKQRAMYNMIRWPSFRHYSSLPTTEQPFHTPVIHRKVSGTRMFIISRSERLNALNLSMVRNIMPQLKAWDVSSQAKVILIKGQDRGKFCVGDDVLDVLSKVKDRDPDALYFFQDKSVLVQMIATLSTPYIAILDGYACAALGLFAHGPFRIATENTIFSMPEASIGAFFNAGSSFFLPRLDGALGTYLALTGTRLEGVDVFFAGIATHYIPASRLTALEERLIDLETSEHDIIQRVLESFVEPVETGKVAFDRPTREAIDRCFGHNTMDGILEAIDKEEPSRWTRETKKQLLSLSPTSLRVTLRALRKGAKMSLCECLKMEFDLIQKLLVTPDFHEGVDAMLISKPRRKAHWRPHTLSDLTEEDIDRLYFGRPSPNALHFPSTLDMKEYRHQFGLPTERAVRLAVTDMDAERFTRGKDVEAWFLDAYQNKWGVSQKVADILARKTMQTDDHSFVWTMQ